MKLERRRLRIDHVLLAARDLEQAARVLDDRYGLASVEGGRHPLWGTANRIVPVGDMYLELVAVVDEHRARESGFGRWVASAPGIVSPLGWAVRTCDIDVVARRLELDVEPGSRAAPDGRVLEWKLAGVGHAAADPVLPFFIEWGDQTPHPSEARVTHRAGDVGLDRIEIRGDAGRLSTWLGGQDLPLSIEHGRSAISRVVLTADGGEIALERVG